MVILSLTYYFGLNIEDEDCDFVLLFDFFVFLAVSSSNFSTFLLPLSFFTLYPLEVFFCISSSLPLVIGISHFVHFSSYQ